MHPRSLLNFGVSLYLYIGRSRNYGIDVPLKPVYNSSSQLRESQVRKPSFHRGVDMRGAHIPAHAFGAPRVDFDASGGHRRNAIFFSPVVAILADVSVSAASRRALGPRPEIG